RRAFGNRISPKSVSLDRHDSSAARKPDDFRAVLVEGVEHLGGVETDQLGGGAFKRKQFPERGQNRACRLDRFVSTNQIDHEPSHGGALQRGASPAVYCDDLHLDGRRVLGTWRAVELV